VNSPVPLSAPEVGEGVLTTLPIVSAAEGIAKKGKGKAIRTLRLFAVYFILAALLYLALRNAPLIEIWNALSQLKLWQIVVLAGINVIIYMLITLRWWIIIRAQSKSIPYLPLLLIRIAVFGVSYFTLGPQIGGEPLQVLYLQRKYGLTYTRATSTVIMDKLLEFLANFFLLVFGLMAVLQAGILSTNGSRPLVGLIPLAALLAWPPIHIMLMIRGRYPVGAVLRASFSRFGDPKWMRFIIASERLAGRFCQRNPRALSMAVGI